MSKLFSRLFSFCLFISLPVSATVASALISQEDNLKDLKFSLEASKSYHQKYNGFLTIVLKNETKQSLWDYRILTMVLIDSTQPYMPGNVIEQVWRFIDDQDEVVLPLSNLNFTLMVYRGDFNDHSHDREVIEAPESKQVFMLDGAELESEIKTLYLRAH